MHCGPGLRREDGGTNRPKFVWDQASSDAVCPAVGRHKWSDLNYLLIWPGASGECWKCSERGLHRLVGACALGASRALASSFAWPGYSPRETVHWLRGG